MTAFEDLPPTRRSGKRRPLPSPPWPGGEGLRGAEARAGLWAAIYLQPAGGPLLSLKGGEGFSVAGINFVEVSSRAIEFQSPDSPRGTGEGKQMNPRRAGRSRDRHY